MRANNEPLNEASESVELSAEARQEQAELLIAFADSIPSTAISKPPSNEVVYRTCQFNTEEDDVLYQVRKNVDKGRWASLQVQNNLEVDRRLRGNESCGSAYRSSK